LLRSASTTAPGTWGDVGLASLPAPPSTTIPPWCARANAAVCLDATATLSIFRSSRMARPTRAQRLRRKAFEVVALGVEFFGAYVDDRVSSVAR
jgi:hypothetical protein